MRLRRLFLASVVGVVGGLAAGPQAGADCVGPTIEHTVGTVDRADTIHVVGTTWGTACYDTWPPPDGVGALGTPAEDIEIVLVQRGVEHVVATGDADADLGFVVDVPVPDELTPGWVAIVARPPGGAVPAYDSTTEPIVVSEVEPTADAPSDDPVTFGPEEVVPSSTTTMASDAAAPAGDDEPSVVGTVVVIAVVVALTSAVVVLFSRARQGPSGPRAV